MKGWRRLGGLRSRVPGPGDGISKQDRARQQQSVDPSELALILLGSAARLLDQAMAPDEVKVALQAAIKELEAFRAMHSS